MPFFRMNDTRLFEPLERRLTTTGFVLIIKAISSEVTGSRILSICISTCNARDSRWSFLIFILFTAKLLMKLSLLHKRCNFMYLILLHEIHTESIFMSFDNVSEQLWVCLVIALMSSCISITVTQQEMFRPLREWMVKKMPWQVTCSVVFIVLVTGWFCRCCNLQARSCSFRILVN